MPDPIPTIPAIVIESVLNVAGLILLWRWVLSPRARREPKLPALALWEAPVSDFLLYLLLAVCGGFGLESLSAWLFRRQLQTDEGKLLIGGGALEAGVLLGVAAYRFLYFRREAGPPPALGRALATGAATFLLALPLVNLVSVLWRTVLDACGLPIVEQDAVDLLSKSHSLLTRATIVVLAGIGAPVMEELLFRAGLFRYLRTVLPRLSALLVPAILFGALHANLAAFLPFVVFGIILSLAYERTGRIGTAIVAHSLFNLNTVVMVLLGFKP